MDYKGIEAMMEDKRAKGGVGEMEGSVDYTCV